MATDIERGLPIRTEDDADQKVQTKIVDHTTPTQGMEVDTDGNAHAEVHGNRCDDAADVVLQLSEEGRPNPRGDYEVDDNSCPASAANIAHTRGATPDETDQVIRVTGITNGDCHAMDVALKNSDGSLIDDTNPLPVQPQEEVGDAICDFKELDIAAGATDNHDYTVVSGKTLILKQIAFGSTARSKWTLEIGDGAAVEVFTRKEVCFTTESDQCGMMSFPGCSPKIVGTATGTSVRLTRENRDDDDTACLNSTIKGCLVDT